MRLGNRIEVLFVGAALAITACGGEDSNGTGPDPGPDIEGTYQLATYDGAGVATMIGQSGGCDLWITGGSLTLRSDRTYERTEDEENRNCENAADNETRTVTSAGTWLEIDRSVTLEEGGGIGSLSAEGTWDGEDTIELTFTRTTLGGTEETDRTYER